MEDAHQQNADMFPCGCFITTSSHGAANRIVSYANRYLYELLGYPGDTLAGLTFSKILTPASRILFESFMLPMIKHRGYCQDILLEMLRYDGESAPVIANAKANFAGGFSIHWSVFSAVQQNKLYQELLDKKRLMKDKAELYETLSGIDELTGLLNRRKLNELATLALARASRNRDPVALLLIDIDHFKVVNDSFGHAEGDLILKKLGKLLREYGRVSDIIARYGGEEFVILLAGASETEAVLTANRLHQLVSEIKVNNLPLTVSIGVSFAVCRPDFTYDVLFESADAALYKAKTGGRNQTIVLSA